MAFDWFTYYAAGVLEALSESVDLMVLTRKHGLEFGHDGDSTAAKLAIFPESAQVEFIKGTQGDPLTMSQALKARKALKEFAPDVVHLQDHFDWRLLLATSVHGIPKVLTVHDVEPHPGWVDPRNRLQRWIERVVRESADVRTPVHGPSLVELTKEQPWYRGQSVVSIPMGAHSHPDGVAPLPQRPTVLFFGRLEYYKGLDLFFVSAVEKSCRTTTRASSDCRWAGGGGGCGPSPRDSTRVVRMADRVCA